jgi:ankyrin repeat protein
MSALAAWRPPKSVTLRQLQARLANAVTNVQEDQAGEAIGTALAAGADCSLRNASGQTVLHAVATAAGVKALTAAGTAVDLADVSGRTPLMTASRAGRHRVVCALLAAGAAVDRADSDRRTALHAAAAAGHVRCAQALLRAGANVNARDRINRTPLAEAVAAGHAACVRDLMAAGAKWDAVLTQRLRGTLAGTIRARHGAPHTLDTIGTLR